MDGVPSALGTWLLPVIGASFLSVFALLVRFAVVTVLKRIDKVDEAIEGLKELHQAHELRIERMTQALVMGNQRFERMEQDGARRDKEISTLRQRFHDLINRTAPLWGKKGDGP